MENAIIKWGITEDLRGLREGLMLLINFTDVVKSFLKINQVFRRRDIYESDCLSAVLSKIRFLDLLKDEWLNGLKD